MKHRPLPKCYRYKSDAWSRVYLIINGPFMKRVTSVVVVASIMTADPNLERVPLLVAVALFVVTRFEVSVGLDHEDDALVVITARTELVDMTLEASDGVSEASDGVLEAASGSPVPPSSIPVPPSGIPVPPFASPVPLPGSPVPPHGNPVPPVKRPGLAAKGPEVVEELMLA